MIGRYISIEFQHSIQCIHCQRKIKKSYHQGFCFPCTQRLACCDSCIIKPELCHYREGTCREPDWGKKNCMQNHVVYLAETSHIKVGITRHTQVPTRWIDQGALQALPILQVSERLYSGLMEVELKKTFSDRTSWQKMLKAKDCQHDLKAVWQERLPHLQQFFEDFQKKHGPHSVVILNEEAMRFHYPQTSEPAQIKSLSLDKQDKIEGELLGIKGQYLIFAHGVFNMRKHTGYLASIEVKE